jgi:intracellular septation protein
MLQRGWMNVREATMVAAGYGWAALMAARGLTNLIIVLYFSLTTWAWFVSVGAVGAKVAAGAPQYAVFRSIVRRRLAQSPT